MATSRARLAGLLVCACIAAAAILLETLEERIVGHRLIDALVISLLVGIAIAMFYKPSAPVAPGVAYAGKPVLNMAVVVLGLTVNVRQFYGDQAALIAFATASVAAGFVASMVIARILRIPTRTSALIATGASICGNSAIAAAAPAIRANKAEVAAAISISAMLGVAQVIAFPIVQSATGLDEKAYGFLSGISVYSVPQAIAASFAVGDVAGEMATTTKLARVLMLGPMVIFLGLMARRTTEPGEVPGLEKPAPVVPRFVMGFLALAVIGAVFDLPDSIVTGARTVAITLFTVAMAAIGLDVNARDLARGAPRAGAAVLLSMLAMIGLGVIGIRLLDS